MDPPIFTSMDSAYLVTHSATPSSDVNSKRNRVPTETEARGLRSLRDTQQRIIELLDSELAKVASTCSSISARTARLLLEVEAGKSELHHAQQLFKTLEMQHMKGLEDIAEIDALLHPIRRVPPELLQHIFKTCVRSSSTPFNQATTIASTCQRWRAIALDTPVLWTRICIQPKPDAMPHWLEFGRVIGARLKYAPLSIHIKLCNDTVAADFHNLDLDYVPTIKELKLQFFSNELLFKYSSSTLPLPQVQSIVLSMSPSRGKVCLPMSKVRRWFPNAERLEMENLDLLRHRHDATYPHVRQFALANGGPTNLPKIFQSFPHLKQLIFASVDVEEVAITPNLTLQHLEHIQLSGQTTDISQWLNSMKCPSLKTLIILDQPVDDILNFLISHRSVEVLEMDGEPGFLTRLDQIHPNLKELHLNGPCDELIAHSGDTEPLLKSLETLVVDGDDLTRAQFESLVCARVLGRDHSLSRPATQSAPLKLRVCVEPGRLEALEHSPDGWPSSELYQASRREVSEIERWTGYVEVSLSWD